MSDVIQSYKDLRVWQKARELAKHIYSVTAAFPREEVYGLTSQIRRSAISVASNIAEGSARQSTKELVQFLAIAQGSLAELNTQLLIATDIGMLDVKSLESLTPMIEDISRMLSGLKKSLTKP